MAEPRPPVERLTLPTPFPVGPVNAYLVHGDPPVLVDAGVKGKRARAALDAGLNRRGLSINDLGAILITHAHFDHSGGAVRLAREAGIPVYCHPAASRDRSQEELIAFRELLVLCGAPEPLLRGLDAHFRFGAAFGDPLEQADDLRLVEHGDKVQAGDLELQVLHTPGHAPGHLCFASREAGLLLCGDLLLDSITPNPLPHFDPEQERGRVPSLPLYLDSLERVEALGPLVGLPGHGNTLPDTSESVRRNREHIETRGEVVLRACCNRPGTSVFRLSQALFDGDDRGTVFLALSETIAHIDRLQDQGRLHLDIGTGLVAIEQ